MHNEKNKSKNKNCTLQKFGKYRKSKKYAKENNHHSSCHLEIITVNYMEIFLLGRTLILQTWNHIAYPVLYLVFLLQIYLPCNAFKSASFQPHLPESFITLSGKVRRGPPGGLLPSVPLPFLIMKARQKLAWTEIIPNRIFTIKQFPYVVL